MTDRVKGFTVTLKNDIRIDDVEPIMNAIKMISGVGNVEPVIANSEDWIIQSRTKDKIRGELYKFIKDNL